MDLRVAFRLLVKNWGFSLTVAIILGLCIGANTAVLSVVNAALLRPLPYPEPERLVQVVAIGQTGWVRPSQNGAVWEAIRDHASQLDTAVYSDWFAGVNLAVRGVAGYVRQQRVSAGFFQALQVRPALGREFTAEEDRAGGPPAVILSHALWQRYFGGDPGVVGGQVLLRGEPHTAVGVMPAGFESSVRADLWTPLKPSRTGEGGGENYAILGRLKPGVTPEQAEAQLAALTPDLVRDGALPKDGSLRLSLISLQAGKTSGLRRPLMLLWAAVATVLLLGCVNVGGMTLARSTGRVSEVATRLALGAPRWAILRQSMLESLALALAGGAAGLLFGVGCLRLLQYLGSPVYALLETVTLDWKVLLAALALTLLTGMISGVAPAWQASRVDIRMAQGGGRSVAGRKRFVSLGSFAAVQVSLTLPLLIGGGLLLRTFQHFWNLDPGFNAERVLTARFSLQDARYATAERMNRLFDETIARLQATPGVEAVAAALSMPYERGLNMGVRLPGSERPSITNMNYVTPGYFQALRIPLLRGRLFTAGDGPSSTRVALVNDAFVKRYFPDLDPLGQVLGSGGSTLEIVGVIGSVQQTAGWGNFGPVGAIPSLYVPSTQVADGFIKLVHTWFSPSWIVRSSLPAREVTAAIERAARAGDPMLPIAAFRTLDELKRSTLAQQRLMAGLIGAIAALAAILAALGLYGLMANAVAERTRELGIRLALGASAGHTIGVTLRPALLWVSAGALAGAVLAFLLQTLLRGFVFGVRNTDPAALLGAIAALLAVGGAAALGPALRIAHLNPAETLRFE